MFNLTCNNYLQLYGSAKYSTFSLVMITVFIIYLLYNKMDSKHALRYARIYKNLLLYRDNSK